jgi:hypothetical protein
LYADIIAAVPLIGNIHKTLRRAIQVGIIAHQSGYF